MGSKSRVNVGIEICVNNSVNMGVKESQYEGGKLGQTNGHINRWVVSIGVNIGEFLCKYM